MRRTILRAAGLALAFLGSVSTAGALSIKSIQAPAALVYSPDGTAQTTSRVRVMHDGVPGDFCVVFTQLSLVPVSVAPAESLTYGLYWPDTSPTYRLALDGMPANANEVLSGTFLDTSKKPFMDLGFAILVSSATMPPPGTYTATILASLYPMRYPVSGMPTDTQTFTVTVTVPSLTDLSIVPSGSPFSVSSTNASLSFGVLKAGATHSLDLMVRSNVRYSVSLLSANGGSLANSADGSLVGYDLLADGIAVTLAPGVASVIALNAPATYSKPVARGITIRIRDFSDFPVEGTYMDSITVNVSAP
jgi:hypothetical protein